MKAIYVVILTVISSSQVIAHESLPIGHDHGLSGLALVAISLLCLAALYLFSHYSSRRQRLARIKT